MNHLPEVTALERAFMLARSGDYDSIEHIRSRLKVEDYELSQLRGPVLLRQINRLCAKDRSARQADPLPSSAHEPYRRSAPS
jgi:hypothetical protein